MVLFSGALTQIQPMMGMPSAGAGSRMAASAVQSSTYGAEASGAQAVLDNVSASPLEPLNQTKQPLYSIRLTAPALPGAEIDVDGSSVVLPATLVWASGSNHSVSAPAEVDVSNDTRFTFSRWSGGVNATSEALSITAIRNVSLSAIYTVRYLIDVQFTDVSHGGLAPSDVTLSGPTGLVSVPHSGQVWLEAGEVYSVSSAAWRGTQLVSVGPFTQIVASAPGVRMVALPVYNLLIEVRDVFGEPLEGAEVSVAFPDGSVTSGFAGGNGSVKLTQLPEGALSVSVEYLGVSSSLNVDPALQQTLSATVVLSYPTYVLAGLAAGTISIGLLARRREKAPP